MPTPVVDYPNMNISKKQYAKAWHELLREKQAPMDVNKKMLSHLYKNGKLSWVSDILRHIENIEASENKIENVTVTTALEYDDEKIKNIAQKILKTDSIFVSKRINPKLIAGAQVETKNKRWDLSLKSQMHLLSKKLQTQ